MLKSISLSFWSLALLVLLPVGLAAQSGYIYTNNDTSPNTISVYSFDSSGTLSQVPYQSNEPTFPTGGNGSLTGYYAANRIIIVKGSTSDFLYASNSGSNSVSAFTIGSGSGYLMPVTDINGMPFSTGAIDNPNNSSISLAATPDGQYLYAGSTGYDASHSNTGIITIFSIDSTTGALTPTNKFTVPAGGPMSSMTVSPDGKYLVAALPDSSAIAVFAIHGPGTPHEFHNSPYVLSSGAVTSVEFNCAGNLLFAGGTQGNIYVFNFASGNLTPVTGSPFSTGVNTSNRVVALSAHESTLYASDPSVGIVRAFSVGTNGDLTFVGSANAAGSGGFNSLPGGLAVSSLDTFLFSADQYSGQSSGSSYYGGFTIFSLAGSSPISFQSLTSTVVTTGFHSLVANPGKVCSAAPAATVVHGH